MTWFARQLKTYSKSGTTVSYTYDANGLRATKTVNGTKSTYVYVNGLLTYEKRGNIEIYFWYDSYGHLMALRCFGVQNSNPYYYVLTNIQGDVLGIYNGEGQLKVSYEYDTWGNLINITDTSGVNIGTINPIRYRGYYYDTETGLYYLQSRYYDPQVGRFINVDGTISGIWNDIRGCNLFAYCFNNPINMDDPNGEWPKWLTGTLNVIGGTLQVIAGSALGLTVSWTGFGAAAAGVLIVNGVSTIGQGIGQIINDITNSNILYEDNLVRTSVQEVGQVIGGDTGAEIAGDTYDIAVIAANIYAGRIGLQQAGLLPVNVNINNVLNNPLDDFVTIGPADGVIGQYCRTIPKFGYGEIYAKPLRNGFYQLANGHHRVAALRALGYETVKIHLVK